MLSFVDYEAYVIADYFIKMTNANQVAETVDIDTAINVYMHFSQIAKGNFSSLS